MRFGEHFCAADFYKSGICRGNCVEIVLDSSWGAVGFLITGAQRARRNVKHEDMKHEEKRRGTCGAPGNWDSIWA
jgi:hypothetical protein